VALFREKCWALILVVLTETNVLHPQSHFIRSSNLHKKFFESLKQKLFPTKNAVFGVTLVFMTSEPRVVQTIDLPVLTSSVT